MPRVFGLLYYIAKYPVKEKRAVSPVFRRFCKDLTSKKHRPETADKTVSTRCLAAIFLMTGVIARAAGPRQSVRVPPHVALPPLSPGWTRVFCSREKKRLWARS